MRFAGARWYFSQRLRRFTVLRRAGRMSPGEPWSLPDRPAEIAGFQPHQQREALMEACRLLDVEQSGTTVRFGRQRKSVGTEVRTRDGSLNWVKVVCPHHQSAIWMRDGELSAPHVPGVSRPSLVRSLDWRSGDAPWCALQFTLAPSPTAAETSALGEPIRTVDDAWLERLKQAIDRVGATPLGRWHSHPGTIARIISRRFGDGAPFEVDEWRTAHGDITWSNLTTPVLSLLDWESWGSAPRGYDAATLLTHSVADPVTARKIAERFADDLNSRSGLVAQLYLVAFLIDQIEAGFGDPRHYRPLEALARQVLTRCEH
jgi:hypothetical protein